MSIERSETITHGPAPHLNRRLAWIIAAAALVLIVAMGLYIWSRDRNEKPEEKAASVERADKKDENGVVELQPETLNAAKIEYATVTERPVVALLRVTGAVEANQQKVQQVTPLVGGRVERVNVA